MIKEFFRNLIFYFTKQKYQLTPVFIIGCGRSGTTILGETLAKHPDIKYLNERRDIWHRAYPEFNIWDSKINNPKLFASEGDIDKNKNQILQKLLFREQVIGSSSILVEKLPINNFRLEFLNKSFPNAKYIYLTRNGLEVSKSIERKILKKNWFSGEKYNLLKQYSKNNNINFEPSNNFEKGLWEWKLSITESDQFFKTLDGNKFIHLSYQDFIENTNEKLNQIFSFLKLKNDEALRQSLSDNINRRSPKITNTEDDKIKKIGGEILEQTINNSYTPF